MVNETQYEEKVRRLKEFGSNHNKFELTLRAFGRKNESFQKGTAVEETITIPKTVYDKILSVLNKSNE